MELCLYNEVTNTSPNSHMKKLLFIPGIILLLAMVAFRFYLYPRLPILNGHAAKALCSCVFVAGIPEEVAKAREIGFFPVSLASTTVDYEQQTVQASFMGFRQKVAYYQGAKGCAIFNNQPPSVIGGFKDPRQGLDTLLLDQSMLKEQQRMALSETLQWAMEEVDPANPKKNTRGVVVMKNGKLVGEKYAEGFDKQSRLLGWSMTKSVTSILYGLMESEGKLDPDAPVASELWQNDRQVTYRHLLQMASGMDWQENYGDRSSVTVMLYESDTFGSAVTQWPITAKPGSQWYYSSGTTNLLTYLMRAHFDSQEDYLSYPQEALFQRANMPSMIIETDASGHFVGSSYGWATARDWARFGQLMLDDGIVAGDTLLPKAWVDFCGEPVGPSKGVYGGHFWLNASGQMPDVPRDAFSARGFHGQRVEIIPSKDLVIVRLGVTYSGADFDFNEWTKRVIEAVE